MAGHHMSDTLARLAVATDRLQALRNQIGDEMELRDNLITHAIETGHSTRTVALHARLDQARVCRIVGAVLAERRTDPLQQLPRQRVS